MATYHYKCTNPSCDKHEEVITIVHGMTEPNKTQCPDCKEETLTRVIVANSGGVRFYHSNGGWSKKSIT